MKKEKFVDFTKDRLTIKQIATITGGWDANGKPPVTAPGNGSGPAMTFCGSNDLGEYACFYSQQDLNEFQNSHF